MNRIQLLTNTSLQFHHEEKSSHYIESLLQNRLNKAMTISSVVQIDNDESLTKWQLCTNHS